MTHKKQIIDPYADQPIYMAYGSNLNLKAMSFRCPKAEFIGAATLPNYRLCFRGVADMEFHEGASCPVGLFKITSQCEKALDRYEGYPSLYGKQYWTGDDVSYMAYLMNRDGYARPQQMYYESIKQGYEDCGLPLDELEKAVWRSFREGEGYGHIPKRYKTG